MKRLILTLILPLMLAAQTARYPSAIATTTDLTDLADRAQTTLSAALNSSATSFTVVSGSKFVANMILTIDSEEIKICSVVGNTVSVGHSACPNVDGRGFAGTVAASHTNGTLVSNYIVAYQFKALREEIKAIETALGINMANAVTNPLPVDRGGTGAQDAPTARANLGAATRGANSDLTSLTGLTTPLSVPQGGTGTGSVTGVLLGSGTGALAGVTGTARQELRVKPNQTATTYEFATPLTVNSADYNFPARTPGGSLSAGNNTITLIPGPIGLSYNSAQTYVYISGGTGTAEAVPLVVAGPGTCDGTGQASCTITVTTAFTHSGAWTVQSASGGIKEAALSVSAGGTVTIPRGTTSILATLVIPTTVTLVGQGEEASGTNLVGASGVSPVVVMADAFAAHADGMGGLRDMRIGGSGQYGLWIGGDPASVFAPSTWQGNYLRFTNILVQGPTTALVLYQGNFITFNSSAFSTTTPGPTMLVHSLSNGELQPVDFYGCLLSSDSGNSVQMDNSGFLASPIRYFGGQVSGPITGKMLSWQSFGTHYEPNSGSSQIVNATAADSLVRVAINGGQVVGLHGAPLDAAFKLGGGGGTSEVFFSLTNAWITVASGTVTDLVSYGAVVGGSLVIEDNDIGDGSTFTNIYTVAAATYPRLSIRQPVSIYDVGAGYAAASTFTFPRRNYPDSQRVVITGATLGGGITAVAGLELGQTGMLNTLSAQTFTAGATIGNTVTTRIGVPYTYYFDGTKIWISAAPEWYTVGGVGLSGAHTVTGSCTLGTNCAVTLTGAAAFTDASHYVCTATDNTSAAAAKVVQASGSAFTITGTATDVISYICVGN